MKRDELLYPIEMRCEQTEARQREHWLEAMADSSTHKGKEIDMPNTVKICWNDSENEWNAYVFTDREGDDWGKYLCHKDLDPPNIKRLAFVAHHDEIMALLSSNDVDNALYGLVMNSLRELEEELRASFDETNARKLKETPRIGETKEEVALRLADNNTKER